MFEEAETNEGYFNAPPVFIVLKHVLINRFYITDLFSPNVLPGGRSLDQEKRGMSKKKYDI